MEGLGKESLRSQALLPGCRVLVTYGMGVGVWTGGVSLSDIRPDG